jgi:hypothetical protein
MTFCLTSSPLLIEKLLLAVSPFLNRDDPAMLTYMEYKIDQCDPTKDETYKLAYELGQVLIKNTEGVLGHPSVHKDGMHMNYYLISVLIKSGSNIPHCSADYSHGERKHHLS